MQFSFQAKKRLHSQTHNPELADPATKKPRLEEYDPTMDTQAKTLKSLIEANNTFFKELSDYKESAHFKKLLKHSMFGNRYQTYAEQQANTCKDPRLALLLAEFGTKKKGLFEDKRVLDIGCHTGQLALQIAI
jgi:2-polyprenyl-3-methyl-5-hydroxy-6-metoxy-1,4-benzoquinol methylase